MAKRIVKQPAAKKSKKPDGASENARLRAAVEGTTTAIMMIDRDFKITYVNAATRDLLAKSEGDLQTLVPGFRAADIVGSCIDIFHKKPEHQRRLLADPSNLPYATDIKVGSLTLRINVSAVHDAEGKYIGNTMEWSDVTAVRAQEVRVARMTSAVQGMTTNIMMADRDGNIVHMNPAVTRMLEKRESKIREVFKNFETRSLIGRNIDVFHKNPDHQRRMLSDPKLLPHRANIKLADLEFSLTVSAIVDDKGQFIGCCVEWVDITEQMDAQRQIERVLAASVGGDLSQRIDTSRYDGAMRAIGDGVNKLFETVIAPLRAATTVAQALSTRDLRVSMTGDFGGEFQTLQSALNTSMDNLRQVVTQIRDTSGNVASAASQIAAGNGELNQRTEAQASSLEETASTMEEFTSTVSQNADNARQANQLAAGARQLAEQGGAVANKAVTSMSEINVASKKIADIIGVIDEIAFQTNLLALNAAVEAARAGEQGRGFAVVAAEVRNLAQRSAGAAKEIKTLINDSVSKVEEGSRLVNDSGKKLEDIVVSVKKVSDIVAEIASASQEQATGIAEVNKAVTQLDQMTQQNAAMVEEATANSSTLERQAEVLTGLVSSFTLEGDAARAAAAAAAKAEAPAPRAPVARVVKAAAPSAGKSASSATARLRSQQGKPANDVEPQRNGAPKKAAAATDVDGDWEQF